MSSRTPEQVAATQAAALGWIELRKAKAAVARLESQHRSEKQRLRDTLAVPYKGGVVVPISPEESVVIVKSGTGPYDYDFSAVIPNPVVGNTRSVTQ